MYLIAFKEQEMVTCSPQMGRKYYKFEGKSPCCWVNVVGSRCFLKGSTEHLYCPSEKLLGIKACQSNAKQFPVCFFCQIRSLPSICDTSDHPKTEANVKQACCDFLLPTLLLHLNSQVTFLVSGVKVHVFYHLCVSVTSNLTCLLLSLGKVIGSPWS